jgi:hypothetical protein
VSNEEASHVGEITHQFLPCATVSSREKRPLDSPSRRSRAFRAGVLWTFRRGSTVELATVCR